MVGGGWGGHQEMEPKLRSLVAEQAEGVRQQQLQQLESLQERPGRGLDDPRNIHVS